MPSSTTAASRWVFWALLTMLCSRCFVHGALLTMDDKQPCIIKSQLSPTMTTTSTPRVALRLTLVRACITCGSNFASLEAAEIVTASRQQTSTLGRSEHASATRSRCGQRPLQGPVGQHHLCVAQEGVGGVYSNHQAGRGGYGLVLDEGGDAPHNGGGGGGRDDRRRAERKQGDRREERRRRSRSRSPKRHRRSRSRSPKRHSKDKHRRRSYSPTERHARRR